MTALCPRGHKVKVLNDRRGACGTCQTVYYEKMLIPLNGTVKRKNWQIYARAYRAGFRAALLLITDGPEEDLGGSE